MRFLLTLTLVLLASSCFAEGSQFSNGFEEWQQFDSPAGNAFLEGPVRDGWLGDQPPYYLPRLDFQMGPARLHRRQGKPGGEVISGRYALGVETRDKPVNLLFGFQIPPNKRGSRYRVSVWLRGKGIVRFRAYEYSRDNRAIGIPFFNTCEATSEWKAHTALFENTVPDVKVWSLVLEVAPNAAVDLDDVTVGPATGATIDANSLSSMPSGMPAPVEDSERIAVAFPTGDKLEIDGRLSESSWQQAEWHTNFLRHRDQTSLAPVQAQFAFLFDAQNLYLGFASAESGKESEVVEPTPPGKWPGGDPLEFFLDPGATRDVYYQFAANVLGCTYESIGMNPAWDCPWKAAGAVEANRWTLEVAIPFAAFGRSTPKPGEMWSVNLCRNGTYMGPWAPVGPNYHRPAGFGLLTFGTYAQWVTAGFLPSMAAERAALTRRLSSHTEPSLSRQLESVDKTMSRLPQTPATSEGKPLDRLGFLEVFAVAQQVRRSLENIGDELRWIEAAR